MRHFLCFLFLLLPSYLFAQKDNDELELSLINKRNGEPIVNGILYEDDKVQLAVKLKPHTDSGTKIKYLSLLDYYDGLNKINVLLPAVGQSPLDYTLKVNETRTVDLLITPPFSLEYLTVMVSNEPVMLSSEKTRGISNNNLEELLLDRLGEEKENSPSREEFLLLIKGSPLAKLFEKERREGRLIFKTISFQVRPKEEKTGLVAAEPAITIFTKDSAESFKVTAPQTIFNRSEFPIVTLVDSVFNSNRFEQKIYRNLSGKFYVQGVVADLSNGIKSVTVNGNPPDHYTQQSGYFDYNLPINMGTNEFTVSVENNRGFIKTNHYKIVYIPPPPTPAIFGGQNHLLLIGADKYLYWRKLQNCKKELAAFKKLMIDSFGYRKEHIYELIETDYSRKNLAAYLDGLLDIIPPEDNLLIFYAGHGDYNPKIEMGYWVPYDAQKFNRGSYYENVVLSRYLSFIKAKRVFLIADACYAGSLVEEPRADEFNKADPHYTDRIKEYRSRLVLASGGLEEVPDKSTFAEKLLSCMKSYPGKIIYAKDLISIMKGKIPGNEKQQPTGGVLVDTKDQNGDFFFERKKFKN